MARLQILQLPAGAGDDRPPFVLVVDEYQPRRYVLGVGQTEQIVDEFDGIAERIGARAVLTFVETVDIPASENAVQAEPLSHVDDFADLSETKQLIVARDEARMWARHGYEIGQKHCGWSDHGVAPDWLTEGWPNSFDSCEHLKQAAELDEAITRVCAVSTEPEAMNAHQERADVWRNGYELGVLAAKSALRPRNEPTAKP
jgi:hypothetical protein